MKIYTRTGDKGTTGLYTGERVPKNHLRLHAYGTLDEMNTLLGLARVHCSDSRLDELCSRLQTLVFILNSDLATPSGGEVNVDVDRISSSHIRYLEKQIDLLTEQMPPLAAFILPGGTSSSCFLHQARTVCRRAERALVTLAGVEKVPEPVSRFVNRMSDYLFVLARFANHRAGVPDEILNREFPELNE